MIYFKDQHDQILKETKRCDLQVISKTEDAKEWALYKAMQNEKN